MRKIPLFTLIIASLSLLSMAQEPDEDLLYSAVIRANLEEVEKLLETDININRQGSNGFTSLIWACTYSSRPPYDEVAKLLISKGADVNISGNEGSTALIEAAGSSEKVFMLLFENGADINAKRNDGRGVFTECIFGILMDNVTLDLAGFILSHGGDVNEQATSGDVEGWTPLHYAVSNGNLELIEFLVDNGADINLPNKDGDTPKSIADKNGNEDIIDLLK